MCTLEKTFIYVHPVQQEHSTRAVTPRQSAESVSRPNRQISLGIVPEKSFRCKSNLSAAANPKFVSAYMQ